MRKQSQESTIAAIKSSGKALMRTPEFQAHIERWGFNFLRSGVLVTRHHDNALEYLCTEEKCMKVNGEYQDVYDVWNLPSGSCLNTEESRQAAGVREVLEETGYHVKLTGFLFVTSKADANFPYTMNVYSAEVIADAPVQDFDHAEVRSIRWMTSAQIEELAQQHRLRSPHFMLKAMRCYEEGLVLPLECAVDR